MREGEVIDPAHEVMGTDLGRVCSPIDAIQRCASATDGVAGSGYKTRSAFAQHVQRA